MTDPTLLGPGSGDEVTRPTARCHWDDCPHGERCVHAKEPDDREALVLTIHRELVRQVRGELIELVADDGLECEGALADAIIAAGFRRHPEPVKPSREDILDALLEARWDASRSTERSWSDLAPEDRATYCEAVGLEPLADAVLALLPGRSVAEVKAEALREAAEDFASPALPALTAALRDVLAVSRDDLARVLDPSSWRLHDHGNFAPDHPAATSVVRRSRDDADAIRDLYRRAITAHVDPT